MLVIHRWKLTRNARPVKKIYTYIKRKDTYVNMCVPIYMYMYNMLVYEIIIILSI